MLRQLILPTLIIGLLTCSASAEGLRVGRAAVSITPAVGQPMLSPQRPPFEMKYAAEAHDPIQAKAIVIDQGGQRVALVEVDLTNMPLKLTQEAKKIIGETTKIDPANVLMATTHTHTAPQLRPKYLGKFDKKSRQMTLDYLAALPGEIAEAVKLAEADLQPAQVAAAIGHEDSVSFNRRYFLRDGTVMTNPFKGEDEKLGQVLRPAGPNDPSVGVVVFESPKAEPLAVMTNFSLHCDTMGGPSPSADFPFMIERTLKAALGPQVLSVWVSGASGNINHYYLMDPVKFHRTKGVQESSRIGAILGAEVLRAYPRREVVRDTPLRVSHEIVRLDYHPEKAPAQIARFKDQKDFSDDEVLCHNENGKLTFDADVQVITLGNELAWVGLPGEMFVELGLALKEASPFRYTIVHSLANGAIGYVPNRRSYPEGGYEPTSTRCAPGAGEKLIESATNQLIKLKNADQPSNAVSQR